MSDKQEAPSPYSHVMGSETAKAIALGASVLSRIKEPAAREVAIRNALTEATKCLAVVPQGAVSIRSSEQEKIDEYKAAISATAKEGE